ncbi:M24 family metallopeptidase, partial [bacterium]|nr:M24 family metallopeptidase [bacterium]
MLTKEAFNALLKTLEEPPSHVLFILATTEPEKIPLTILSRCQRYEFHRISVEDIKQHLLYIAKESGMPLTEDAADLIAVRADGGLRDALSLLDQCSSATEAATLDAAEVYDLLGLTGKDQIITLSHHIFNGESGETLTLFYRILQSVPESAEVLDRTSPIQLMKAMKTPAEQENERLAHIKDGVAVTRFIYWLKHTIGKEPITELSASKKLESLRAEGEHYLEQSFDPILAYGAHGAIVHYEPTEETDIPMEPRGLCLADTGAQYLEGTTDITRTIALGPLADEEKRIYTLVLRGHIQLGAAKFLHGCMGENLDMLARTPLWEAGLDFNHGTGHGVGFVLGVHEGPERVHWDVKRQKRHCVIEEGMIFSNEPGIYLAGKFGVRIENLVVVREAEVNEYGRFLALEPLTLVPYDRDAIDLSLLSSRDVELLNAYHAKVFAAISPYLSGDELEWLKAATEPVQFC